MRTIIIKNKNVNLWKKALHKAGIETGKFSPGVSRPGVYYTDKWTNEPHMGRLEVGCSGTMAHKIWMEYNK